MTANEPHQSDVKRNSRVRNPTVCSPAALAEDASVPRAWMLALPSTGAYSPLVPRCLQASVQQSRK